MNKELLRKYAELIVKIGVNIQKDQELYLNSPIEAASLTREVVKVAYEAGAKAVHVNYNDSEVTKAKYQWANVETLEYVPNWLVEYYHEIVNSGGAVLSIISPDPLVFEGVDQIKIMKASAAINKKIQFYREHTMASKTQWSIAAYPNPVWAKKVFPNLTIEEAESKLLEAILKASRVTENNDPVTEWKNHMEKLDEHSKALNDYAFKSLKFHNSKGTNLEVGLVENHIWAGGKELSSKNIWFAPNIPTEEVFTMPSCQNVNGTVVSTMPLNYNGQLIEDFSLTFVNGRVEKYQAQKGQEILKSLLEMDEGSRHLGEVALISYDSPISNMGILFYNTLFDENASCHLALGNAYPMNLVNGTTMTNEELVKAGANKSIQHVDFMFGSSDMEIDGIQKNGKVIPIFRKGNFVI